MKKRILALVLSLVMALTLFGCGGNDAHNNDNNFSLVFHNKSPVRNMSDFQLTNIT